MSKKVLQSEMTWPELAERLRSDPVVFIPCGATEQHGPHLPLGVDVYLSTAVAREVAMQVDGIVAPAISYGYKSMPRSGGGPFFPGTINLDGATLISVVRDITREWLRHGVRKICFFDGHFENQWFLTEGIDLAVREARQEALRVMRFEYWDFFTEQTLMKVFPSGDFSSIALEHAAVIETSLMLHFHPDLVRAELIPHNPSADPPPYDVFPARREFVTQSGALITAGGSTAEKGKIMADQAVADIVKAVCKTFDLPVPGKTL
ncbi:MAG: creatininase [Planctomycetota bacterium]|nr:creatininase [Planctomycetota bacterium]